MKIFEEPIIEIVRFETKDIICVSGCDGFGGNNTEDDCLNAE